MKSLRGDQKRTKNEIFHNSGTRIIYRRQNYDWSLSGNQTGSTSSWDAIRGNPGAKMTYQDSGHCSCNQGIGYQGCQTYGRLWDAHRSGGVNNNLTKMEWRLRIGRTGCVGNQSRATSVGFFFSWMEWRLRIGRTGRVENQSCATSAEWSED